MTATRYSMPSTGGSAPSPGRRRLVLVLDDMHWADRPSLLLLEYLLRSSTPAPLLIVATYRQTDTNVSGWFSESLAGIRRTTSVENIALDGPVAGRDPGAHGSRPSGAP